MLNNLIKKNILLVLIVCTVCLPFYAMAENLLDDSNDSGFTPPSGNVSNPGSNTSGNVSNPGSNTSGNVSNPNCGSSGGSSVITNPLKGGICSVYDLVYMIVTAILIPLGSVLIVLMIIFAGFQFVIAQGNPTKIEDAKKTLFFAIIGSAILLGSWAIAEIIKNTVTAVTGTSF